MSNSIAVKKTLLTILRYTLFFGVGSGILWWLYISQNTAFQAQLRLENKTPYPLYQKLINDFRSANFFWLMMTLAAFTFSNFSRAKRWNMLITPLGFTPKTSNSFFAVNISYFTNLWMSRAGEVVRAGSLARAEGQSVSKIMGTVVVDRLLDLVSLALIVGFSFIIEYDTLWSWLDKNLGKGDGSFRFFKYPLFIALGILGLIVCIVLFIYRKHILDLPLLNKLKPIYEKFSAGFKTIGKIQNLPLFIFHSVNIWLMYFLMTYFCFFAFAPTSHLGWLAALNVFVFGTFGMVIPSPGGMGTYHFLASSALSLYHIKGDDAFSFANIMFFTIQIFYNVVAGLLSIYLIGRMNKKSVTPIGVLTT